MVLKTAENDVSKDEVENKKFKKLDKDDYKEN